jgi:hypothetical protein
VLVAGVGESESICCTPSYCSFEQWICKFLVSKSQCFRNKIVNLFESIYRFNYAVVGGEVQCFIHQYGKWRVGGWKQFLILKRRKLTHHVPFLWL